MPSLHGFRSRSRLRCGSSSSRPSTASSVDTTAPPPPPPPPVPALPDNVKLQPAPSPASTRSRTPSHSPSHSQSSTSSTTHPALALYPFLGNLARFSGAPGEDIDLWLASVDAVAQHVAAPPDAPVPLIPLLLRGDAFRRFVRMHHDTRGALSTWAQWKAHLRTEFRAPHYMDGKTDELAARGWRATETLAHYFDARRELQMVVMPEADEEELVQDMLGGVPLRQRRLLVDSLPPAQRDAPSLAALRRAMVDCEVEMRGRARLDANVDSRRAQSHSPAHRASKSLGQVPFPATGALGSSSVPDKWTTASAPLSPPLTPRVGVLPPPPTITVS